MTISSTVSQIEYAGNGSTVDFPTTFEFIANADLTVVLRNSVGGETVQTLGTHYTVTGAGDDAGGTVVMVTAPASGEVLAIRRNTSPTQETDYIENDPFPAEVHEAALDKLTLIAQENANAASRAVRAPISDSDPDMELPPASQRANLYLAFNASGNVSPSAGTGTDVGLREDLADSNLNTNGLALVGATADLAADVALIGGSEITIVIADTQVLTADLTIPSNVTLKFLRSGTISVASTFTCTIQGSIEAGDWQIFAGAGDISFAGGTLSNASVMWFGVVGSVGTDDYVALFRMRDALRTTDGVTLTFPPRSYEYSGAFWIKGIKNLVVNAWGATFKNTLAGGTGFNIDSIGLAINANAFDNFSYTDTVWPGDNHEYGYLIDTVAAGGDTIVCSTASEAGNFAAGDKVIVYGYGQQSVSHPPNPRYFEYKTVLSADAGTGAVVFEEVLKYKYRSDWWDYSQGKGAGRIINMNRAAYDLGESLEWNGGEFLVNPLWATTDNLNGKVQVEGYRKVTLNNVIMPAFVPSACERIEINKCTIGNAEVDKVINYLEFNNSEINNLTAGTGVNVMVLNKTQVVETMQAWPRVLIIDGSEFSSVGAAAPTVMVNLATTYQTKCVDIRSGRFNVQDSAVVGLLNGGAELSVTAASAPSNTSITVTAANDAAADDIFASIDYGIELRTAAGGKSVIVTDIYKSGATEITIEGDFSVAPAASDVYYYSTIQKIKMENIHQFGPYAPVRQMVAFARATRMDIVERDEKHFFVAFSQDDMLKPASAAAIQDLTNYCRAILKSVYVNVTKAYSGADIVGTLQIRNHDTGTTLETIDLLTTGARYMTEFANSGSAGADSLANLSSNSMAQFALRQQKSAGLYHTYVDATELPMFTVVLEFVRYR